MPLDELGFYFSLVFNIIEVKVYLFSVSYFPGGLPCDLKATPFVRLC